MAPTFVRPCPACGARLDVETVDRFDAAVLICRGDAKDEGSRHIVTPEFAASWLARVSWTGPAVGVELEMPKGA